MAGAKEIRGKIASVQNTQKITKAMEMVATSKMRKSQEAMMKSKPYAHTIRSVISHIANGSIGYKHPFLTEREIKNVGYLVISTDRGLCGGLNINLFKKIIHSMRDFEEKGVKSAVANIGSKASAFFGNLGVKITSNVSGLGDRPQMEDLVGSVNAMLDAYRAGEIDAVYVCFNRFVNTMTQEPVIEQLLPLPQDDNDLTSKGLWDYIYEPSPEELLDALLVRYIESQVYQAVVDNLASEQAARMVAMKAATDNAGNLIGDLQLVYNKARQASITNELNEIVAGAAAI